MTSYGTVSGFAEKTVCEYHKEVAVGPLRIGIGLFYVIAALMSCGLLVYNFALWIGIPLLIVYNVGSRYVIIAVSCAIYFMLTVLFATFVGALVHNTIWRHMTASVIIMLIMYLPSMAPITIVVACIFAVSVPIYVCLECALSRIGFVNE